MAIEKMPKKFVAHLPDLMTPSDYRDGPGKKKVRLRIRLTGEGVEILGDAAHVAELEALLDGLDGREMERVLCG